MKGNPESVAAADRLLQLAQKAKLALRAHDRVTAQATWKMLTTALSETVRHEPEQPPRFRVGQARFNSIVKTLNLENSLNAACDFWTGFKDGLGDATKSIQSSRAYDSGYSSGNLQATT